MTGSLQLCGRENSIDILADTVAKYNQEDNNKFKTIVVFDCRGLEPVEFSPRNGWRVSVDKNNKVDLSQPFSHGCPGVWMEGVRG